MAEVDVSIEYALTTSPPRFARTDECVRPYTTCFPCRNLTAGSKLSVYRSLSFPVRVVQ
jgi:hypothetical protein